MVFDCPEEQHVEGKYARELFYIIIRSLNVFLFAHCNQITLFIIKMRNRFIHPKTNRIKSFFNFWSNFEGG